MKKGLKILLLYCVCIGLEFGLGSKNFIGEELEYKFASKENKEKNISNKHINIKTVKENKDIKSDKLIQKKNP